ncbi:MAG: sugar transferase [Actinobacteria bacterium]|nr:sugar transferase [Actinomycetota bacterium]
MSEQPIVPNDNWEESPIATVDGATPSRHHGHDRSGRFIDHDARDALFLPDHRNRGWEDHLIRRLVVVDVIAFVAAEVIAAGLMAGRIYDVLRMFGHPVPYLAIAILGVPAWVGVLSLNRAYDRSIVGSSPDEYTNVMRAVFVLFTLVCAAAFMGGMSISRGLFAVFFPMLFVFSLVARLIERKRLHARRASGRDLRRIVLISRAPAIGNVTGHFARSPHAGYNVVGAYLYGLADYIAPPDTADVPILGEPDDLVRDIDALQIDAVALSGTNLFETESLRSLAWQLHDTGIQLLMAPDLAEIAGPRIVSRPAAGLPLLLVDEPHVTGFAQALKSVVERFVAFVACVVLAPVFLLIALVVKCSSRGPVLFRQTRIARRGEEFSMLKFRSMVDGAEAMIDDLADENESDGLLFKIHDDPRVTAFGKFLRKFSLDELPQLWNVVRGDMALVGPRPPLPSEVEQYEGTTRRRLMVKPGITGLWQVSGRSNLSWEDSVRLDLYYVENWSPLLDVTILAKTVKAVVAGHGAY